MSKSEELSAFESRLEAAQKRLRAVRKPKPSFRPLCLTPRVSAGLLSRRLYDLAVMAQPVYGE